MVGLRLRSVCFGCVSIRFRVLRVCISAWFRVGLARVW